MYIAEDSGTATATTNKRTESKEWDKSRINNKPAKKNYKELMAVHEMQKEIVKKNMHRALSPISAISGYLELMKMFLQKDADMDQIERYRAKIDEGVSELGELVEDLYEEFNDEKEKASKATPDVAVIDSSPRAS